MKMQVTSSAHTGLNEWLFQRLSAIYLALFVFFLIARFYLVPIQDFSQWQAWFESTWIRVAWLLAFTSLLIHAWTGIRSVLLDYVKDFSLRFTLTVVLATGSIACGFWVVDIFYGRGL